MRGIANAMQQGDRVAQTALAQNQTMGFAAREMAAERRDTIPAKITFYGVVTAGLKWKYEWQEVRFTASTTSIATKVNGLDKAQAGFAYNWNELANAANFWAPLGNPANIPAGFALQPIAIGTPVLLFPVRDTTGKVFWVFDKVNAIDGECP